MTFAIQRYLVSSSLLFGAIGTGHGVLLMKIHNRKIYEKEGEHYIIRTVVGGALYGLLLGPWAPIIGPIWLAKKWPGSICTHVN
jgi:hypothetical protein